MAESQSIEFSDCIRKVDINTSLLDNHIMYSKTFFKVYRHPYQKSFQLEFTISLGEGRDEDVTEPITVAEVNGRTSFEIKGMYNVIMIGAAPYR